MYLCRTRIKFSPLPCLLVWNTMRKYKYLKLFLPSIIVQVPQFQWTNAHNCHLIHNNIFINMKLHYVSGLIVPSSGRIKCCIKELLNSILNCCIFKRNGEFLPVDWKCVGNKWCHWMLKYKNTNTQMSSTFHL